MTTDQPPAKRTDLQLRIDELRATVKRLSDITDSAILYASYGSFMVVWAQFEAVVEIAIMHETKMEPVHSIIVCSGLGFERKASILRSLLALKGDTYKPAISLINRIVAEAERNALIHSLANAQPKTLEFLRRATDQKLAVRSRAIDGPTMNAKKDTLHKRIGELMGLLGISSADFTDYESATRSLASN